MAKPVSFVLVCVALLGPGLLACAGEEDEPEPYVYADELEPTQDLSSPRSAHAAVALADGRVLVVGGIRGAPSQLDLDAFVAEVELYDPETESFEQGAALAAPRSWPSATRLADGRVVVLGGTTLDDNDFSTPALGIEVWDPTTESFSAAGELPAGGALFPCAAPLGDEVLVIDDCIGDLCTPLRIDPDAGITTLGGVPSYAYSLDVDCALLPDGRVFLAGGTQSSGDLVMPADYAEIYDPDSESFERVGPMSARYGYDTRLTSLADGRVLIFGHADEGAPLGQIFSPSTGEFTPVAPANPGIQDRSDHTLTLLADGRVLIAGGILIDSPNLALAPGLALFDPATGGFESLSPTFEPRRGHAAVRLEAGPVLIIGGQDADDHRADAFLFR